MDDQGQALEPRLAQALTALADRFRREYPVYRDDGFLIDALEAAARKILRRGGGQGAIGQLDRYAWITLKHVAISAARRASRRLLAQTVASEAGAFAIASLPTPVGTVEQIEGGILLAQLLQRLTRAERAICRLRTAGYSSVEIAERLGTSPGAIDVAFVRLRRKLRRFIDAPAGAPAPGRPRRPFSR